MCHFFFGHQKYLSNKDTYLGAETEAIVGRNYYKLFQRTTFEYLYAQTVITNHIITTDITSVRISSDKIFKFSK